MTSYKLSRRAISAIVAILLVLLLLPLLDLSNYWISFLVYCFTYSALGGCWNLIGGYAAQISWCHAAFVSIGAYTSFLSVINFEISPYIGIVLGALISMVFAGFVGMISFRLRGVFFSLCTIAFSEIVRLFIAWQKDFTKGNNGLIIIYKGNSLKNLTFETDIPFYYIMLFLLAAVTTISFFLNRSKTGYYLRAIRADEDAAESLGIQTSQIKLKAFVASAGLTSVVGSFYAFFISYIDPTSVCGLDLSTKIGAIAIVGGMGTVWGPVIGGFVLFALTEGATAVFGSSGATMLPYGLVLVIIMIFRPGGIISFFQPSRDGGKPLLQRFLIRKKAKKSAGGE